MADIFISYARQDRERIEQIADALATAGFSVWWDRNIKGGAQFAAEIERELSSASVVIVAWSEHGVISEWVREEAAFARENNKLLPIRLSAVRPPLGFRQRQAIDLSDWNGEALEQTFSELISSARLFVDGEAPVETLIATHIRTVKRRPILAISIGALALGLTSVVFVIAGNYFNRNANNPQIIISKFELTEETNDLKPVIERMQLAILQSLADWGIAAAGETEMSTGQKSGYTLAGLIDNDSDGLFVNFNIEENQSRKVLWSKSIKTNNNINSTDRLIDVIAKNVGVIMRCSLSLRSLSSEQVNSELYSILLRFCDQEHQGNLQEMHTEAYNYLDVRPDSVIGNTILALSAAKIATGGELRSTEDKNRFFTEARKAAEKVLASSNDNPIALNALGLAQPTTEWRLREDLFRKAMISKISPPHPRLNLTHLLRGVGRNLEAADILRRAAVDQAGYTETVDRIGWLMAIAGDFDEANHWFERAREIEPGYFSIYELWIKLFEDDPTKTLQFLDSWEPQFGESLKQLDCYRTFVQVRAKQVEYTDDLFDECWDSWRFSSRIYAAVGDVDSAFKAAEGYFSVEMPWFGSSWFLFYPETRSMRHDPRFWTYVERIGLVDYWLETDHWPDFCTQDKNLPYDCREAAIASKTLDQ